LQDFGIDRVALETRSELTFSDVYRAHFDFVYRVVARLAGSGDVEDLVQEVFVVVHRRLGEFRGDARVSTWLFRIAYRVVGAHVRRERLRRRLRELLGRDVERGAPPGAPEDALARKQSVRRALQRLSFDQRSALVLFEVEGWSALEIAEAVGSPIGTVYRRLHEARGAFAAELAPAGEDGGP
jgi:RNA polymerase sigma-70 factor, ECF subfamily